MVRQDSLRVTEQVPWKTRLDPYWARRPWGIVNDHPRGHENGQHLKYVHQNTQKQCSCEPKPQDRYIHFLSKRFSFSCCCVVRLVHAISVDHEGHASDEELNFLVQQY